MSCVFDYSLPLHENKPTLNEVQDLLDHTTNKLSHTNFIQP